MKTKKDRSLRQNEILVETFIYPYAVSVMNIISFITEKYYPGCSIAEFLTYLLFPALFTCRYLYNMSKELKMCIWHTKLIGVNACIVGLTMIDRFIYSFGNTQLDILSIIFTIQLISFIVCALLHWKYGMCEKDLIRRDCDYSGICDKPDKKRSL